MHRVARLETTSLASRSNQLLLQYVPVHSLAGQVLENRQRPFEHGRTGEHAVLPFGFEKMQKVGEVSVPDILRNGPK
jgi:hypothetical protein